MLRTTKLITISIFPELLKETEKVAKEENRTRSELIREALRRYIAAKELKRLQRYGSRQAKKLEIKEGDVQAIVDEYRVQPTNG
jgi:CopG family transcriptional regulator/antitoxin EndoAI